MLFSFIFKENTTIRLLNTIFKKTKYIENVINYFSYLLLFLQKISKKTIYKHLFVHLFMVL